MKSAPLRSDHLVERLRAYHPRVIDLSLGRIERLLDALGNPHHSLHNVIHLAGTNGKGSTLAFLKAICEAAGLTVHAYTSPHLVHFNERISVAGRTLDDAALLAALDDCEAANAGGEITFFEMTTAAAILAFSRMHADVTLIETGLGGRFDATNVFPAPALTVITPVSMDHMSWLGDTIEKIAFEKAGILKPGVVSVIGPQVPEALSVIERRAEETASPLLVHGRDWFSRTTSDGLMVEIDGDEDFYPRPALAGAYQPVNAATAIVAARQLSDPDLPHAALARGLTEAFWPGRMQDLSRSGLGARLPEGWSLHLDGGHNVAAAGMLVETVDNRPDRPLHLVFGALSSRNPADFLQAFAGVASSLQAVSIPGEETSLSSDEACDAARRVGIAAETAPSVAAALDAIAASADGRPGQVLICGSLYLAGAVLAELEKKPR